MSCTRGPWVRCSGPSRPTVSSSGWLGSSATSGRSLAAWAGSAPGLESWATNRKSPWSSSCTTAADAASPTRRFTRRASASARGVSIPGSLGRSHPTIPASDSPPRSSPLRPRSLSSSKPSPAAGSRTSAEGKPAPAWRGSEPHWRTSTPSRHPRGVRASTATIPNDSPRRPSSSRKPARGLPAKPGPSSTSSDASSPHASRSPASTGTSTRRTASWQAPG